jgi:hypothetical protein
MVELAALEKYRGTSSSSESDYEGGSEKQEAKDQALLKKLSPEDMERYLQQDDIDVERGYGCCLCCKRDNGTKVFYKTTMIEDKGFNKWVQAQD